MHKAKYGLPYTISRRQSHWIQISWMHTSIWATSSRKPESSTGELNMKLSIIYHVFAKMNSGRIANIRLNVWSFFLSSHTHSYVTWQIFQIQASHIDFSHELFVWRHIFSKPKSTSGKAKRLHTWRKKKSFTYIMYYIYVDWNEYKIGLPLLPILNVFEEQGGKFSGTLFVSALSNSRMPTLHT